MARVKIGDAGISQRNHRKEAKPMRLKTVKSKNTSIGTVLDKEDLSLLLSIADALGKAAPPSVALSDEILLRNSTFEMAWIEKKGSSKLNPELASHVDGKIIEALTECTNRRARACKAGVATHELPSDSRLIALNRAAYEAERNGLALVRAGIGGEDAAIKTEDPRNILLVKPVEEPVSFHGDYLVSGSNVVGGPTQLPLFQDAIVDVVYFLHGAPYLQIRAKVPLGLAVVTNLKTRISGSFIRERPEDTHLSAVEEPLVYVPDEALCEADITER